MHRLFGHPPAEAEKESLIDMDVEIKRGMSIRPRDIGGAFADEMDLESSPRLPSSPFTGMLGTASSPEDVSQRTWELMRDGSGIQQLVDACPEDVVTVLKNHAVVKLGTFQATDSDVLKAFGKNTMLTRGSDLLEDPDWRENWTKHIQNCAHNQSNISIGWEEMVSLGAYAVNIKNIAVRDDRGALLELLLQKSSAGAASKKIWEFPAVRAVINYHWAHWAWKYLLAMSLLFLCWLGSFTAYLVLYIDSDEDGSGIGGERSPARAMSYLLSILCFVFMCPFAIIEGWTMYEQGWRWIQPINLLDVCAIVLQAFIFGCHAASWSLEKEWFGSILAVQCVVLFAKLQNFGRVLGAGASFSEIFLSVMFDVRYLLMYLFLTGISSSLCLGAIYKHDAGFATSRTHEHFDSVRNAMVTTFQIIFGSFDTAYIFDAEYAWVKIIFFFGFQVLMTITVLNLLIAVMTDAYSKFAADQRIRYNKGRASVIDELEVLRIPSLFAADLHPYIHFAVVEKRPKVTASQRPSLETSLDAIDDLRHKLDSLSEQVQTLVNLAAVSNHRMDWGDYQRPPLI